MLPKRFDQAKPFVTLGILILVWLVVPTGCKRLMRLSFFEFQAPLDTVASAGRDLQEFWSLRTRSKNELIEAGRELGHLNARYETGIRRTTALEAEVKRLEELLKLPTYAEYRSETARVARRDFSGWWQTMRIRKGRNYGIPEGAPVIFTGGVVGRVTKVGAYTSEVELISSPTFRLAVVVEGDTRPLSFQGGVNPTFGPAKGVVEFVPLDMTATPTAPKRLVTSGVGGIFPAGLRIGDIVRMIPSTDGLFKSGEVRLDQRLDSVTEVAVLIPLRTE